MPIGKVLLIAGFCLILVGLFFTFGGRIPFLGKLPGDIRIQRDNLAFYFPLTTSLMISFLVSFLIWLFRR